MNERGPSGLSRESSGALAYVNGNPLDLDMVPLDGVDPRVRCGACPAVCCRKGTVVRLSPTDAEFLRQSGTELEKIAIQQSRVRSLTLLPGSHTKRYYVLQSDCGNLKDREDGIAQCSEHDNPNRPSVCREFRMGGAACVIAQLASCDRRGDAPVFEKE